MLEKREINVELAVDSSEKKKTKCESQQDLEKIGKIKGKQQHAEETAVRKEFDSISKILINKGMKSKKMVCNKNTNNIILKKI